MLLAIVLAAGAAAPTDTYLDQSRTKWEQFSRQIWGYAETALHEEKSATVSPWRLWGLPSVQ